MPQDTPSRKLDQYIVRFPDGMRDRLKAEAAENNRSLNAEIVQRLGYTLAMSKGQLKLADLVSAPPGHPEFGSDYGYGSPPPDSPPAEPDLSEFEREFIAETQRVMRQLLRRHGMNPIEPVALEGLTPAPEGSPSTPPNTSKAQRKK